MKIIRNLIYLLLIALMVSSCSSNGKPDNFDYGRVEFDTYLNNYFDFSIDLPSNWIVQSREQTEKIAKMGTELVGGDDDNLKAMLKASEINTANLLTVFQYELGTAVEYNPNIMIVAENIKNSPGIKTGSDYLFQSKRILEQGQFKYNYLSSEFESETIGGAEFYKMTALLKYMGLEIKQIFYSTILNGFSFNVIISYVSDEQKEELTDALNTMVFIK